MRKWVLLLVGTLLVTVNAFAGAGTTLNGSDIAKSILSKHSYTGPKSGEFTIVYGGQDISRGSIDLQSAKVDQPVAIA